MNRCSWGRCYAWRQSDIQDTSNDNNDSRIQLFTLEKGTKVSIFEVFRIFSEVIVESNQDFLSFQEWKSIY